MKLLICFLTATLVCAAQEHAEENRSAPAKQNPYLGQKPAIGAGERHFRDACAACHGPNAEGGRGPNLAENADVQHMPDDQLFNIIERGIPGTSMPPSGLPDQDAWQIAAFLRSLGSPASLAPVTGDSDAGRDLFFGSGTCSRCHAIRGVGGLVGPDLSNIGAETTLKRLRDAIVNPSADIRTGFDQVFVTLKSGKQIRGVAKDNSNYFIQLLDLDGRLHSINKSDVKEIVFERKSLMPELADSLGPDGLNNVVAFLARQVTRPIVPKPSAGAAPPRSLLRD